MGPLDLLCDGMIAFYEGDPKRIQHFLKVHSLARLIAVSEGVDAHTRFTLEAAAYVHDIGVRPAEEKYGSSAGSLQEKEGPAPARTMLEELYFPQDVIDRVVFLVGRHHTDQEIDGADFQILVEADTLVNLCEEGAGESAVWSAYRRIFRTESGKRLLRLMFRIKEL